ncbi:MAG TPA: Rv2578c family radical SAM protein [Lapillicoccus sp.]|nr:Rv2578c family radical SAM protein [Lapillicoccus sp.]
MRWQGQSVGAAVPGALPGLEANDGFVRTVRTPEFAGITFHEVLAKSALNRIPAAAQLPFEWTVNPYRGCTHACVYCFARNTHTYLDLDAGRDFDTQIVVKTNVAEVLARELHRPSWDHAPVALGTNTDPYQRAEGRYRLMPGIIAALAGSGTPFSILTKGPTAKRDLPLLTAAARDVDVGFGVSIAIGDEALHHRLEPGTASPRARLDLVKAVTDAGIRCHVMVAPVIPMLSDDEATIDALLARVAAAGATSATALALHLRPGTREWWFAWLEREHPELLPTYRRLYARGTYASPAYLDELGRRVRPLLERHGLVSRRAAHRDVAADTGAVTTAPVVTAPTLF